MNILFLSTVFPDAGHPSRGTYNLELCGALAQSHEVRVISPRGWSEVLRGRMAGKSFVAGETITATGIEAAYPTYWYPPGMLRGRYGDFMWQSSRSSVERLSKTFVPDAVLSYWAHPDGEAALRAARQFGVPSAVIVGGSDVLLLPRCPKRGERVRRVLAESDAVLTVSEGLRESVIALGVEGSRVHTVYQGVNESIFHRGDRRSVRSELAERHAGVQGDRPLLLWVGRMVDLKRLDVLVEACAAMRARGRDFVLCLAGDGPERANIEQQVSAVGLNESVVILGALAPAELGDWYRAADVTVLASESEGLPNVLRESLSCGTPFVSTDMGSIGEIADERFSSLAPVDDADGLARAIETVLAGSHREEAERYETRTWNDTATEVLAIFRECGAGGNVPSPVNDPPVDELTCAKR